jgi:hypothetical protein
VDDAMEQAHAVLDAARRHGERGNEAWALRLLGEITSARPGTLRPETPAEHYRNALALAGELGMQPLAAHCHLGLGRLYRRVDKGDRMREEIAAATSMYREMGMRFWLRRAETDKELRAF